MRGGFILAFCILSCLKLGYTLKEDIDTLYKLIASIWTKTMYHASLFQRLILGGASANAMHPVLHEYHGYAPINGYDLLNGHIF